MAEVLFFISAAGIGYTYLGYFLIVMLRATFFPRRVEKRYGQACVSVVIVARNEELSVRASIENIRSQDYPVECVEIVIVSDGSTDRTVEIAREFADEGVVVVELAEPVGRARALNAGVQHAANDIVVFADARHPFSRNVIAELTANLHDESVGAVSGQLVIESGNVNELHQGLSLYSRYEMLLRRMESTAGSVVGVTASIYAIRRALYVPLASHAILDAFLVSMRVTLQGYRVLLVRSPRAFDASSRTSLEEFRVRARALAGVCQAVALEPALVDPRRNPLFFEFLSHKLARIVAPWFFVVSLLSSAAADGVFFDVMFWLQAALLGLGLLRYAPVRNNALAAAARVSWTFSVLNAAAVAALWMFVTGRERMVWRDPDYEAVSTIVSRK